MANGTSDGNPRPALAAINEWSCALACVCWVLAQKHSLKSQNEIINEWRDWFPEWKTQPGMLRLGDIMNLLPRLGFKFGSFAYLDKKVAALAIAEQLPNGVAVGFVLTRRPTQHCMAVVDGWNAESVMVMNPDPANPSIYELTWDHIFKERLGAVLWIAQA